MRILVLSNLYPPDFIGGYELACAQVVDALRARRHEVQVLTARPRTVVDDPSHVHRRFALADEWRAATKRTHAVSFRIHESQSRFISAYNVHVLSELLEEFSPAVVYVNNLVGLGGLGLIGCLQYLEAPWVWHLGDCIPRELTSTSDGIVPGLAAAFARTVHGSYAAVSRRIVDENSTQGLVLSGRVELIPYWITGTRPPLRDRFHTGGPLRIISVGRVNMQKGMRILIHSLDLLRDLGREDFSLDVFGAVHDPSVPALTRSLGLDDRVRFMGILEPVEILERYPEYDVCAFPTQAREPFGLVPLEAASRGCVPVIADNCGIAEWFVHGVHCLKSARRPEAFARLFHAILEGRISLAPIARRAYAAAWRDFHLDAVLPLIERMLEDEAARVGRASRGRTREAYQLARMAEQLTHSLIQESLCAEIR